MSTKSEYLAEANNEMGVAAQPWLLFRIFKALANITPSASYRIRNFLIFGDDQSRVVEDAVFISIQNTSDTKTLTITLDGEETVIEAGDDTVYTFPNSNNQVHENMGIAPQAAGTYKLIYQTLIAV